MRKIALLTRQARAQLHISRNRAVDAFAEPQSRRVIFLRVVHRLERLRTNSFYIPEMKEFVRGDAQEHLEVLVEGPLRQSNRGAVGMFHATNAGGIGKVIDEK